MFKKIICLIMALTICCIFCLFVSASWAPPANSVSQSGATYDASVNYFTSETSVGGSVPSGYSYIGALIRPLGSSGGNTYVQYLYSTYDTTLSYSLNSNGSVFLSSSRPWYYIVNSVNSSGDNQYLTSGTGSLSSGNSSNWIFYSYVPVYTPSGDLLSPPTFINLELNVLNFTHLLYFNCSSDTSGNVHYYIFPSTLPLVGSSTVASSGTTLSMSEDTSSQQSLISRGFNWFVNKAKGAYNPIADAYGLPPANVTDNSSYVLNVSSPSAASSTFQPTSYNLPYADLGSASIGSNCLLDLKSVGRTGVYSQDSLCLLAVYQSDTSFSYARFDFSMSAILSDTVVPSVHTHSTYPAPTPDNVNDLQDLADYLKELANGQNINDNIRDQNLIANLMAMPWANYVGTGFGSQLPNLSMYLDSLFNSLFDKYTAPSEEQINLLVNEVNEERAYLREKLAFVADVKSEVFFIQSTFISAGDNPRPFRVTLPDFMMGYTTDTHKEALVRYDLIDNTTRQAMHDVIIVFCTLAVVMHIWHTLPSTVGNMPRD